MSGCSSYIWVEYHIGGVCLNDSIDVTVQVRYKEYGHGDWKYLDEKVYEDNQPNGGRNINVNWTNTQLTKHDAFWHTWEVRFIASSNNHNCPDVIEGWKPFAN